tara:strand:+ start:2763 stop:2972 length:210 start_codon:yes stop_codon:yes gene_type:complete
MMKWFYYNVLKRIQGAKNGNEKTITKGVSSPIKDERWSNGETNCIRHEFKSQDNKHIQAKNLGKTEHKE